MDICYRFENKGGEGPYKSRPGECFSRRRGSGGEGSFYIWANRSHGWFGGLDRNLHPNPNEEFGEANAPHKDVDNRCGFASLEQMASWFNKFERRRLRRLGYRLAKYEGKILLGGGGSRQVIFRPFQVIGYVEEE